MRTEAYGDYSERLGEALELVHTARVTSHVRLASAASKGAVVLAAAALERYMNDAVLHICRLLSVDDWSHLGPGFRSYLSQQIARRLQQAIDPVLSDHTAQDKHEAKLRKAVQACVEGFEKPSTWDHHPQFGLLRSGDTAPDQIGTTLARFSSEDRDFMADLDVSAVGRDAFMRSLSELVDARHTAAHALPDRSDPGPRDAQAWIVSSFWLVRRIDRFLLGEIEAGIVSGETAA